MKYYHLSLIWITVIIFQGTSSFILSTLFQFCHLKILFLLSLKMEAYSSIRQHLSIYYLKFNCRVSQFIMEKIYLHVKNRIYDFEYHLHQHQLMKVVNRWVNQVSLLDFTFIDGNYFRILISHLMLKFMSF